MMYYYCCWNEVADSVVLDDGYLMLACDLYGLSHVILNGRGLGHLSAVLRAVLMEPLLLILLLNVSDPRNPRQ